MDEQLELLEDFLDCMKRINNPYRYGLGELVWWERKMSAKWASKGPEYAACFAGRFLPSYENQSIYSRLVNLARNLSQIPLIKVLYTHC